MRIRHYTPADLDALRCLHAAQGFGYSFPDLESPLFVTKLVLEDDGNRTGFSLSPFRDGIPLAGIESRTDGREAATNREEARRDSPPDESEGAARSQVQSSRTTPPRIVMAALLRLTAESYLLHDATAGTPRQRWQNLLALHEAARQDALSRGLDDVQAFLPPPVARAFGRRLARLGWRQDPWPCFSRGTGDQWPVTSESQPGHHR